MKKVYLVKTGTTFPTTAEKYGDFDDWVIRTLGEPARAIEVVDVTDTAALSQLQDLPLDALAGIIITGSHAMVTDGLDWSLALERWLPKLVKQEIPIFGICYGHQLLAHAMGGKVGFHPLGKEVGTVEIDLLPSCEADPLFRSLPPSFLVQVTHAQTVLELPLGAERLAANIHEPNHAYRLGACAWGVQFHPEYTPDIMRDYLVMQEKSLQSAGQNVPQLLGAVADTPFSAEVLRGFAKLIEGRST